MEKIEELLKKIEETPDDFDLWLDLGIEYGKSGKFKKSMESMKKSLHLNPESPEVHYNLGVLYSKVFFKDISKEELWEDLTDDEFAFEMATKEFQEAISLDPEFVEAYSDLGMLFKIRHIDEEAIRMFKKSLELDPDQDEIRDELAEITKTQRRRK
ncbi:MAG TPA: tetratricopeptide repeat protein [Firmicutes bacterium]|nr:tetratricopeptide repeat protein [Bacillota bacterium]